jgi:hypothetical protein
MSIQADVSPKNIQTIKNILLQPALTSHFAVKIQPPQGVIEFMRARIENFDQKKLDELTLLCSEATLPGSSMFTSEVTGDFTGVTEKMVYRRQYDDQSSFTFYVDQNYKIIEFLEGWMNYIVGEGDINSRLDYQNYNASYRVKFRDDSKHQKKQGYAGEISIAKFERNMGQAINTTKDAGTPPLNATKMEYNFIKAYPISIDSMPVSYEGSTILKCIVNFTYIRYVRTRTNAENDTK